MLKQEYLKDMIFVIDEFISPEECQQFIARSEEIGYDEATITTRSGPMMRKDIRNNTRVMFDDLELADRLFDRAKPYLVPTRSSRQPIGFNERFRFYRYEPGQRFAPHFDGPFDRGNGERSMFSFLIYLNEDFEGGETRFFEPQEIAIKPQTGQALAFYHQQLHEGAVLLRGVKYVLRTDVMYGTP
ncbi:MAG: hypothetical protein JWN70_7185 [Planctomycetaceae bacterium]|nr:hypothetical protein [Planctomycetaceae bacterium]